MAIFFSLAGAVLIAVLAGSANGLATRKPHLVFLLADDQVCSLTFHPHQWVSPVATIDHECSGR